MTRIIKRGDLESPLVIDVVDVDGVADLNTADSWRLLLKRGSEPTVVYTDGGGGITVLVDVGDASRATITHPLEVVDTDTVGSVRVEVEVLWPGVPVRPQTFPTDGTAFYRVEEDLG
jgi:hypothetical protein